MTKREIDQNTAKGDDTGNDHIACFLSYANGNEVRSKGSTNTP
ncbi:hypothetical protein [Phaeobacter inhibens]|nr:hypothetical protein [Phaeobacter inhibens]